MSDFVNRKYWTLPDAGERSPNDPMYLISSDSLLRILNMEQTFEKPLKKRDITEALLVPVIEAAAERGWKAAVTNGKQLLLSIEEIGEVPPVANRYRSYSTVKSSNRETVYVPFQDTFSLTSLLTRSTKPVLSISNVTLEGIFFYDGETRQRFVGTSGSETNQFIGNIHSNRRVTQLRYRDRTTLTFDIEGTVNLETADIELRASPDCCLTNLGALVSFDLWEG